LKCVTLARLAMATRFEIVLHGTDPAALRAAGEDALNEIDRLENQLSLYRQGTEVARLNAQAAREPVRVTPTLFALLEHARKLSLESGGAFDITIAPLVRCWGFMDGTGRLPEAAKLAEARANVGMHLVQLDPAALTVRFARQGVMLDLGAIGKGYAIERAAEVLREAGVTSALLHGGTSSVYGLGSPPGMNGWKVAVRRPPGAGDVEHGGRRDGREPPETQTAAQDGSVIGLASAAEEPGTLTTLRLKDEALSVSAVWGKFFQAEGRNYGHVLDPRTGQPATAAVLAAVVLPSATETDALSTALLVRGAEGHDPIAALRPGMRTLLVSEEGGKFRAESRNHEGN
jgi:thiamine biosynthesis lipoprotein